MGFAWHKLFAQDKKNVIDVIECINRYCCCSGSCVANLARYEGTCDEAMANVEDCASTFLSIDCPEGCEVVDKQIDGALFCRCRAVSIPPNSFCVGDLCYKIPPNELYTTPDPCCCATVPFTVCITRTDCDPLGNDCQTNVQCFEIDTGVCCDCHPDYPLLDPPDAPPRDYTLRPRTGRLQHSRSDQRFTCYRNNFIGGPYDCATDSNPRSPNDVRGYFETPVQDGDPGITSYGRDAICVRMKSDLGASRAMVISGYNRYRYAGPSIPQANNCPINLLLDNPGASGIKQMEEYIRGPGSYPLPDAVLTYPVWGSSTLTAGGLADECYPLCVNNPGCFTGAAGSDEVGYVRNQGQGYTSFACFNPWGIWKPTENVERTDIPSCSVYSMLMATYDRVVEDALVNAAFKLYSDEAGLVQDEFDTLNPPQGFAPVQAAFGQILSVNPSGSVVNGVDPLMAKIYAYRDALKTFYQNNMSNAEPMIFPQVFLWDRVSYLSASPTDRIKHLYVPGSLNILADTGCTDTNGEWKAFKCYVDEATHSMQYGSTHAAQVISFSGCNRNSTGYMNLSLTNMGCAAIYPQGGNPIENFCENCASVEEPWNMDPATECFASPRENPSMGRWCTCSGCD